MGKVGWGVAGILGFLILFYIALPKLGEGLISSKDAHTNGMLGQLLMAIHAYKAEYNQDIIGDNPELYRALTGENPRQIEFMQFNKQDVNARQEILDGWGTPFEVTSDAQGISSIRSAGKDRKMNTDDDIVLNLR